MKNIINFYGFIVTPMLALVSLAKHGAINSFAFTIILMIYGVIYHPLICAIRLVSLGVIRKKDIFYCFIPFYTNYKYFDILFTNRKQS